jgi:hypothetical protein
MAAVMLEEPVPLETRRPDLPPDLFRLVRRCLRKDPSRRIQTARDVLNELLDVKEAIERPDAARVRAGAPTRRLVEGRFPLGAEIVRGLSERNPRIIGDTMTYLDNEVTSDVLVVYVAGLGLDQRMFAPVLSRASHRAVAVTLYGFGPNASHRVPLSLDDHSRLLRALFRDLDRRCRPRHRVLVGFSAGADHVLRMGSSEDKFGIPLDGLLVLGPNSHTDTCRYSRAYVDIPADGSSGIVPILRSFGREIDDLPTWLVLHDYLVQTFVKFGANVRPLTRYAKDIVAPFDARENPFSAWYRAAAAEVGVLRIVFTRQDQRYLDDILTHHLDENVLGPGYREDTIVLRPDLEHLELSGEDLVLEEVETILRAVTAQGTGNRSGAGD